MNVEPPGLTRTERRIAAICGESAAVRPALFQRDLERTTVAGAIRAAAESSAVDPALLRAVIAVESNFNANAVSRAGARGLMQLMPATAATYGVADANDPAQNVRGGAAYLRDLLDRFRGDIRLAVAAYNAGPAAVERYGGVPPYAETQTYVERVMESYRRNAAR